MVTEADYRQYQNQLANNKAFRYVWQFWSNYGFVFFIIAALIIFNDPELIAVKKPIAILGAVSFFIARGVIVVIINNFYRRKRPYQEYNFTPITSKFFSYKTRLPNSFPSRHAITFFAIAALVALYVPTLGAILMIVSGLTGVARIILGYHWPSDILAGAVIGIAVGVLTGYLGHYLIFT